MEARIRVLFLCTGNSCRSQMAEGWLRHLAGESYESLSAGTQPQGLNPLAVEAMAEAGIDISSQRSEALGAYLPDPPEVVVTVCDRAAESCPTLPGTTRVMRWSFADPAQARGEPQEVAHVFRDVRDQIRARIEAWLNS